MPEQTDSESELSEQLQYTKMKAPFKNKQTKKNTVARCPKSHRYKTGKEKHNIQDNLKILQG